MKSILFCCYGLGIGGIEKCLVNLINVMPETEYNIDLLLMNPQYDFLPDIKRRVTVLDSFRYVMNTTDTSHDIAAHGGVLKNRKKTLDYCLFRLAVKFRMPSWHLFNGIEKKYDIAVAYSQNDFSPYYVIDKVKADRKVLWYHNGAYKKSGKALERDRQYYTRFDYIVAVSSDCARVLQDKFGFDDKKLLVLHNVCDPASILKSARAFDPQTYTGDSFHVVTVGRLTAEKGADLALQACHQLCSEGKNICWHWVGDGNEYSAITKKIEQLGLQRQFLLEGDQTNPYPYMRCADVYVQPSYYEAYSTTVTEARILCKPIIATDVGGMRDQLVDGKTGIIVPIDSGAIADAIRTLMNRETMRESFSAALRRENFDTTNLLAEYEEAVFS